MDPGYRSHSSLAIFASNFSMLCLRASRSQLVHSLHSQACRLPLDSHTNSELDECPAPRRLNTFTRSRKEVQDGIINWLCMKGGVAPKFQEAPKASVLPATRFYWSREDHKKSWKLMKWKEMATFHSLRAQPDFNFIRRTRVCKDCQGRGVKGKWLSQGLVKSPARREPPS